MSSGFVNDQWLCTIFHLLPIRRYTSVEFHIGYGDMIRLLRTNGFEILDLIEIQAPAEAETHQRYDYVSADWARKWPSEEIWRAQLRHPSS